MPNKVKCNRCNGLGYIPEYGHRDNGMCYACEGAGVVTPNAKNDAIARNRRIKLKGSIKIYPAEIGPTKIQTVVVVLANNKTYYMYRKAITLAQASSVTDKMAKMAKAGRLSINPELWVERKAA